MEKLLPVLAVLFFLFPKQVLAGINVEISGNGPGSKSEVTVESDVKSSTTNDKSSNRTDIRIENNGEVKEFHGEGNQNIRLESGDKNNSVNIINDDQEKLDDEDIESSESASISAEFDEEDTIENAFSWIEFIKNRIKFIFNVFSKF